MCLSCLGVPPGTLCLLLPLPRIRHNSSVSSVALTLRLPTRFHALLALCETLSGSVGTHALLVGQFHWGC